MLTSMSSMSDEIAFKMHHTNLHFEKLQGEIRNYYALQPAKLILHPDSELTLPSVMLQTIVPIPRRIPLIAGDCLQNLRSCFDYLVWQMVTKTGKTPSKQSFPVCTTPEGWANAHGGRLRGIPAQAKTAIHGMQPYKRGSNFITHPMYVLDELTNINKHRHLLFAVLAGADMTKFIPTPHGLWGNAIGAENGKIPAYYVEGSDHPRAEVASFVAFNEGPAKGIDVCSVLGNLINWCDKFALPLFDSFL